MLRLGPRLDRALFKSQAGIRDYEIEIQSDRIAKALAGRACAIRIVKAEQARLGLSVNGAVIFALKSIGKL